MQFVQDFLVDLEIPGTLVTPEIRAIPAILEILVAQAGETLVIPVILEIPDTQGTLAVQVGETPDILGIIPVIQETQAGEILVGAAETFSVLLKTPMATGTRLTGHATRQTGFSDVPSKIANTLATTATPKAADTTKNLA